MKLVGIDFATDPRDCGVCVLEADIIVHVGRGTTNAEHPEKLADYCTGTDVVGIDVPFVEALGYEIGIALDPVRGHYHHLLRVPW